MELPQAAPPAAPPTKGKQVLQAVIGGAAGAGGFLLAKFNLGAVIFMLGFTLVISLLLRLFRVKPPENSIALLALLPATYLMFSTITLFLLTSSSGGDFMGLEFSPFLWLDVGLSVAIVVLTIIFCARKNQPCLIALMVLEGVYLVINLMNGYQMLGAPMAQLSILVVYVALRVAFLVSALGYLRSHRPVQVM